MKNSHFFMRELLQMREMCRQRQYLAVERRVEQLLECYRVTGKPRHTEKGEQG